MAKYKCPSSTCNFTLEGSVYEIVNPAIWHAQGSHNANPSEEDIYEIIDSQAKGIAVNSLVDTRQKKVDIKKWIKKINQ